MNATRTATTTTLNQKPPRVIEPKEETAAGATAPGTRCGVLATTDRERGQPNGAVGTRHPIPAQRRLGLMGLVVVASILAGLGLYRWWEQARSWVRTDNAYVAAHIHEISFRVAGTVKEVLVNDNQKVAPGEVLARLDAGDFAVRLEQARAQLAQVRAQAQRAQAQVVRAQAQTAQEQARLTRALQDAARAESLFHGSAGAISKQEYDAAQTTCEAARAALRAAEAAGESAVAEATAGAAQVQAAEATLKEAELQLSYTELCAPARGSIGRKNLESGNRVQAGQALLALVEPAVWVVANFKETQLRSMRPGQAVELRIDAFPARRFTGRVESLAPASGAQFALLPPDNATGNFTKIAQRVPVKIVFDPESVGDYAGRLTAGMSSIVAVKVR